MILQPVLADQQKKLMQLADDPPHCHHEKSFLIDAGCEGELAFIGGIGMSSVSMVTPEHRPCIPGDVVDHHAHDIFFELQGPSGVFIELQCPFR